MVEKAINFEMYGLFELELLAQSGRYGIALPQPLDFGELEYLISMYESLDEEDMFFVEQAQNYRIPIKEHHLLNIMKLCFEIEDYESSLKQASKLGLNWDTSVYDPFGLVEAINHDSACELLTAL
jgi:hypothetical protein